jgi:hypothetical protein
MKAEKKREFSLQMLIKLLQSVLALMRQKSRWPMGVRDGSKTLLMKSSCWQRRVDDGHLAADEYMAWLKRSVPAS